LWTALFGESLPALRSLPALLGVLTAALSGLTARRLGGGGYAAALAMLCVAAAPEYLALFGYYSMNCFEVFFWTLAAYVLVRILYGGEERLWPWLGLVLGLGLLNKLSVLWLGLGLGAGLLLTGERRRLSTRGPWLAAAIALLIAAPHFWWQVQSGWPTAEFIRNATSVKMKATTPVAFLLAQIDNQHPLTAPVWLLGLVFTLFRLEGRVRPLGVLYLTVFGLLVVNQKSRAGYLAAAYPMLLACGAVWIEALTRRARWLRPVSLATLALGGLATAPLVVPVLSPEGYVAYARRLGVAPSTEENKRIGALPQFFADRTGWPDLVLKVEGVLATLPPQERAGAVILASNYGQAGALETLAPGRLPRVVSGHNNYWLWGPGAGAAEPVLVLANVEVRPRLDALCAQVEDRGEVGCRFCMPYESRTRVFVCRGLREPLPQLWPRLKHFD